jgi:hypothetical protein
MAEPLRSFAIMRLVSRTGGKRAAFRRLSRILSPWVTKDRKELGLHSANRAGAFRRGLYLYDLGSSNARRCGNGGSCGKAA